MNNRPFANLNSMMHEKKGDVKIHKSSSTAADAMRKIAKVGLCDGCDSTTKPVSATDDGRALLCSTCMTLMRKESK